MLDPRQRQLAKVLVHHSTRLQAGEKVLIEAFDVPDSFTTVLIEEVAAVGAIPIVELRSNAVLRKVLQNGSAAMFDAIASWELARMEQMDAYIGVRGAQNAVETSDVPATQMKLYQENLIGKIQPRRINHTKWVVLRYPTPSFAQAAGKSTEAFEDFYFRVCTLDYERMAKAQEPLVERMLRTDRVRLTGVDTDIAFSIKDIGVVPCAGARNIPDGECFSAPVRDSVNGVIHYNAPTIYQGKGFDNIRLVFKDGKIIEATGSDTAHINAILDTDEGARYIGEFAIGFNPHVLEPMRDILFDEKINGSFHFTPGQAYKETWNGNHSNVHWDMVFIQRPEYGGGEIWFDDELIRKDGLFVPEYLHGLNPENLI
jgi:aminopeptidase